MYILYFCFRSSYTINIQVSSCENDGDAVEHSDCIFRKYGYGEWAF